MKSLYKILGLALLIVLAHFLLLKPISKIFNKKKVTSVESTVLMERFEKVCKIVNIEGYISEILDYKDFEIINFPGFRKKALIKAEAKILVGYDLENINIRLDHNKKIIFIDSLSTPQILAIDNKLSYYDLSEGLFNNFKEEDLNQLNNKSRQLIEEKVNESSLFKEAENQMHHLLMLFTAVAAEGGWELKYKNKTLDFGEHKYQ